MAAAATPAAVAQAAGSTSGMSVLDFVASITGSLAWPLTLLIVILVFKPQWIALAGKVASFEGFGVKVNFAERAAELSVASSTPTKPTVSEPETPQDGAASERTPRRNVGRSSSPTAGMGSAEGKVLTSWLMIERALREAGDEHDLGGPSFKPLELLFELQREGVLTPETVSLIEEARHLRNAVVHGKAEGFNFLAAQNYAVSAENIASRIRVEAGLSPEGE